jgi:hypothetical protein
MATKARKAAPPPDEDLEKLVKDVQGELAALVKSAAGNLAKVHDGESTEDESPPDDSAASPSPPADASAPPAGAPPAAPPTDISAGGPPGDASAPPDGSAPPGADDGSGGGPVDHDALVAELIKLPPEQIKAYYVASRDALAQVLGAGGGAPDPMGGGAPPPDASAPPAGGPPPGPPAMKSEAETAAVNALIKNEQTAKAENATLRQELATLTKSVNESTAKLAKYEKDLADAAKEIDAFVHGPKRRAITSTAGLTKTEPETKDPIEGLTKTEIKAKLRQIARKPSLTKAERKDLEHWDVSGDGFDKIKHLFAAGAAAA